MTLFGIEIPEYGDRIWYNGQLKTVHGIHVYFGKENKILSYRVYIGSNEFITIKVGEEE